MSGGLRPASSVKGIKAPGLRAAAAGRQAAAPEPVSVPVTAPAPAPVKKVRLNAEIDRDLHRWFKGFAFEADSDMALVLRALLTELRSDEALAERVRNRLSQ